MQDKQVKYQHIYREGNQLVDHLANIAIDTRAFTITSFQQLEKRGITILNSDKWQSPYLRITPLKG